MMKLYAELEGADADELGDILLALRAKYPGSVLYMENDDLVIELRKGSPKTSVDPFPTQIPNTVHPYPINPHVHSIRTSRSTEMGG